MKKVLTFIIALALIFTLSTIAYAEETATDMPDINEEITVTEAEEKGIIDTIMNSTIWGTVATYATMAIGIVIFVTKKLNGVISIVKSKADTKEVIEGVNATVSETFKEIRTTLQETETKLAETQESEKTLLAVLSMYIVNDTRYNPNAKAEIMKYISGIKAVSGSVSEICEKVTEDITKANEAEIKEDTPALDSIVADVSSSKMALD